MTVVEDTPTEALLDGRYRLIERVGAGGSADVHRAEDVLLGRIVAIKLLRGEPESPLGGARVRRETALLASLNHPSIVTLYDAQLESGRPQYLVMEYVEGRTLAAALGDGPLRREHAAVLAHDLAAALAALHARGIVHRDVKPSNVLLGRSARRGEPWTAKLADFGIAHVLDDPRVTTPGTVVGTAAYMAPEQVRDGEVVPASDVYSLGLVLLEALTGERAFRGASGAQAALARLSGPPAVPPALGEGWSLLLTRMTRTDPGERPSAAEVAAAASGLWGGADADAPLASGNPDDVVTEVLSAGGGFSAHTEETKVLQGPAGEVARERRSLRGATIALLALLVASVAAAAIVWAVGASDAPPARQAREVSFVKTPAAPVEEPPAEDEESSENPGNRDGKGKKSDDGDSEKPGKKDDED